MLISVTDIARAISADVLVEAASADALANAITWDSREVAPGSAFLCLTGERVDGHDFIPAALTAGAVCAIVTRDPGADVRAQAHNAGAALLKVPDAQAAFEALAQWWRGQIGATVVGLTGSCGKTTTKNLVRDVVGSARIVVATLANQNNELGVPRTVLAADPDTDVLVVEMGMRGLGQIDSLCAIAAPDWGVITNVGDAHMELLGSQDNIARAKSELFANLPAGGWAFVNAANGFSLRALEFSGAVDRGVNVAFYDGSGHAEKHKQLLDAQFPGSPWVWAQDIHLDDEGCASFTLCAQGFAGCAAGGEESVACSLALQGLHNVSNAASAAAVGLALGMSLAECAQALETAAPEKGRQETLRAACGALIVNDSYNANPDSMRAALSTFCAMRVPGRRIAVLGDMYELGAASEAGHRSVGALCAELAIDQLICVGDLARDIAGGAQAAGMNEQNIACVADASAALEIVQRSIEADDAVLVKASHAVGLERIVEGLAN